MANVQADITNWLFNYYFKRPSDEVAPYTMWEGGKEYMGLRFIWKQPAPDGGEYYIVVAERTREARIVDPPKETG